MKIKTIFLVSQLIDSMHTGAHKSMKHPNTWTVSREIVNSLPCYLGTLVLVLVVNLSNMI